jgi:hypothetical protein
VFVEEQRNTLKYTTQLAVKLLHAKTTVPVPTESRHLRPESTEQTTDRRQAVGSRQQTRLSPKKGNQERAKNGRGASAKEGKSENGSSGNAANVVTRNVTISGSSEAIERAVKIAQAQMNSL